MSDLEFQIKALEPLRLAAVSSEVDTLDRAGEVVGPNFDRLVHALIEAGTPPDAPGIAFYDARDDGSVVATSAFPYDGAEPAGAETVELPGAPRALTVVHRGRIDTVGDTWQALVRHAEDSGLTLVGVCREVYLRAPEDDPQAWLTELQQPVEPGRSGPRDSSGRRGS